jgi:hypothetical protein
VGMTRFDRDGEFLLSPTCEAPCVRAALVKRSTCGIVRRELSRSARQSPAFQELAIERPHRSGMLQVPLLLSPAPSCGAFYFCGAPRGAFLE